MRLQAGGPFSYHRLHFLGVGSGEAHAQKHNDHQHQAHGAAEIVVVAVAQELQLDEVADEQVRAAAQHAADDERGDAGHEHHGDARGDARHGKRHQHLCHNVVHVCAKVLRGLDDAVVDFDHDGVVCDKDYTYLMDFILNAFDGYFNYTSVSDKTAFEVNTTAVDLNMDGVLDIQDAIAWNKLS